MLDLILLTLGSANDGPTLVLGSMIKYLPRIPYISHFTSIISIKSKDSVPLLPPVTSSNPASGPPVYIPYWNIAIFISLHFSRPLSHHQKKVVQGQKFYCSMS